VQEVIKEPVNSPFAIEQPPLVAIEQPSLVLLDGSPYGCDFLLDIEGFQFCYAIDSDDFDLAKCSVYFSNEDDEELYSVYFTHRETEYKLGDLKLLSQEAPMPFGVNFSFSTAKVDAATLLPIKPIFERANGEVIGGFISSFNATQNFFEIKRVNLVPWDGYVSYEDIGTGTEEMIVARDAVFVIYSFDTYSEMLLTKERFSDLYNRGYEVLAVFPCYLYVQGNVVYGVQEVWNP